MVWDDWMEKQNDCTKVSDETRNRILQRTQRKIRGYKMMQAAKGVALCLCVGLILSAVVPGTITGAVWNRLFAHIPGIGPIEVDHSTHALFVMGDHVWFEDDAGYIEVEAAYQMNDYFYVSLRTNIGVSSLDQTKRDALSSIEAQDLKFLSLSMDEMMYHPTSLVKAVSRSPDSQMHVQAWFQVKMPQDELKQDLMLHVHESTNIRLSMEKAAMSDDLSTLGNYVIEGEWTVLADSSIQDDWLRVTLHLIAPDYVEHVRYDGSEYEQDFFEDCLHIVDQDGRRIEFEKSVRHPTQHMSQTFLFPWTENMTKPVLVIPQLVATKLVPDSMRVRLPAFGESSYIHQSVQTPNKEIILSKLTRLAPDDESVPIDFRSFDCLRMEWTANTSHEYIIMRIIPRILVKRNIFTEYKQVSQAVQAEIWDLVESSGHAYITFDDMQPGLRMSILYEIEYAYTKPMRIKLDP